MKKWIHFFSAMLVWILLSYGVFGHCENPGGIYNDAMRFDMITEHLTTKQAQELKYVDRSHFLHKQLCDKGFND